MATRLPSLGKSYEHVPNGIVDFIKTQCRFNDVHYMFADPKFSAVEQRFVESIFYGADLIVRRFEPRPTGGSTLVAMIASYYALCGKDVVILSKDLHIADHIMHTTFPSFMINTIKLSFPNKKRIELESRVTGESFYIDCLCDNDIARVIRARSTDYVFVDTPTKLTEREIQEIAIHVKPGGKLVMNMM